MRKRFRSLFKKETIDPDRAQKMIDTEYDRLLDQIPELRSIVHHHPVYDETLEHFGIANPVTHDIRIGPKAVKDPEQLPGTLVEEILHNKYGYRYHFHGKIKREVYELLQQAGYSESVCKKSRIWIDK